MLMAVDWRKFLETPLSLLATSGAESTTTEWLSSKPSAIFGKLKLKTQGPKRRFIEQLKQTSVTYLTAMCPTTCALFT